MIQLADCLSTPAKTPSVISYQQQQYQQAQSLSGFADEVCQWLDRQPNLSYRNVELPPNILTAFPTTTNIGHNFIELERKNESNNDQNKRETDNIVALHLIPTPTRLEECLPPKFQKDLTDYFNREEEDDRSSSSSFSTKKKYSKVVHLHQDIWNHKREIVRHRLMAQLGLGVHVVATTAEQQNKNNGRAIMRRIFARKTKARRINASVAMEFLDMHHLWGATKAKHNYGLFVATLANDNGGKGGKNKNDSNDVNEELVAVATFSSRRKIIRSGKPHRSHELLRFCSRRDSNVVGGISKLIKAFVREKTPDDIVTVVDRDWGDGSGWYSLGFHSVATMDPMVMAVCPLNGDDVSEYPQRRHLVGAGIQSATNANASDNNLGNNNTTVINKDRLGLSIDVLQELDSLHSVEDVLRTLSDHGYFPVYDTGVQRLMKVIHYDRDGNEPNITKTTTAELWQNSKPTYAKEYYSPNLGISVLLKHASMTPSALPQLIAGSIADRCE